MYKNYISDNMELNSIINLKGENNNSNYRIQPIRNCLYYNLLKQLDRKYQIFYFLRFLYANEIMFVVLMFSLNDNSCWKLKILSFLKTLPVRTMACERVLVILKSSRPMSCTPQCNRINCKCQIFIYLYIFIERIPVHITNALETYYLMNTAKFAVRIRYRQYFTSSTFQYNYSRDIFAYRSNNKFVLLTCFSHTLPHAQNIRFEKL